MNEQLRVIDSHVHFWDPAELSYPWIANVPALNRAFSVEDYRAMGARSADGAAEGMTHAATERDTQASVIDSVIFVEANCAPHQNMREVELVNEWATGATVERSRGEPHNAPLIAGIVAYVDMLDVKQRTAALARLKNAPRVVGVRHNIQGHSAGYCTQSEFVRGVAQVGDHGLVFDLCATADQLNDVYALASQCEHTQFVLDHCGKPDIAGGEFSKWAKRMDSLGRLSNVSCKMSGLFTQASELQRTHEALVVYAGHAVGCFSPQRLMYGSDWPVLTLASATELTWRAFALEFSAPWSAAVRQAFFADNAARTYKLSQTFRSSNA